MPKLSYRCSRRGYLPPVATVAFSAPPRKVSFEDGHSDSDSSSLASSPVPEPRPALALKESSAPKLPTLRRPKSSLSLVDMAKGVDCEDHNSNLPQQTAGEDSSSMLVSPGLISPRSRPLDMEVSPSPLTPTSPWGYFVDMVIPLEGTNRPSAPQPQHVYNDGHSSCRRRRSSPYGDYKKQRRSSLCFQGRRSIPLPSSIQLAPRRKQEPADQLIGALDRLQVD